MTRAKAKQKSLEISIDTNLTFDSEESLYAYFERSIKKIESEYCAQKKSSDLSAQQVKKLGDQLDEVLDAPDEVWKDTQTLEGEPLFFYIRKLPAELAQSAKLSMDIWLIAACFVTQNEPTFVYLHFATKDLDLVNFYRRGEQIFAHALSESIKMATIEGDALIDGDSLSVGLFAAMLQLRGDKDIPIERYKDFASCRDKTIQEADEIWRSADLSGNVLVTFVKEFTDESISMSDETFTYVVVTQEDSRTNVHALLFSFPTNDASLIDRYRHGENLQADEIVQESSH